MSVARLVEPGEPLEVGQRVDVDPYLTCGTCPQCRRGRGDLCPFGARPGGFGNVVVLLNERDA